MCVDLDSSPPIAATGAMVRQRDLTLSAPDGNTLAALEAHGDEPSKTGVVVLPDVRGLHDFYKQLAVRFGEAGHDSVAIDYFGRTAGLGPRDESFSFMDHVPHCTAEGVRADVAAAVAHLRSNRDDRAVFTVGFCFGGSNSWHQAANGHGLAGAVGFYGNPKGERPAGAGYVIDRVKDMACPILGLMGGDDPGIPAKVVAAFDKALEKAAVEHEIVTYPGAPHSFFDRKYTQFASESADAWKRVLTFLERHS